METKTEGEAIVVESENGQAEKKNEDEKGAEMKPDEKIAKKGKAAGKRKVAPKKEKENEKDEEPETTVDEKDKTNEKSEKNGRKTKEKKDKGVEGLGTVPTMDTPRQRKKPETFVPVEKTEKIVVPKGVGTALGDIPNVAKRIIVTKSGALLRRMHNICFPGQKAEKLDLRGNLRLFKGLDPVGKDDEEPELLALLGRWDVATLKEVSDFLDLEHTGKKDVLGQRIASFLFDPQPSGHEYKSAAKAKGKRKGSDKKTKANEGGKKRTPSAYILFTSEERPKLAAANPDASFGELGKMCGAKWNELSEDKKQKYQEKAQKLKDEGGDEAEEKTPKKQKTTKGKDGEAKAKAVKPKSKKEKKEDKAESGPVDPESTLGKVKARIAAIIKDADLDTLTAKAVRGQLHKDFGEKEVDDNKDLIKVWINEEVEKRS